jgi:hypothetical protein
MVHHEKLVYVEDIEVTAQKYREYLLPKIKKVPGPLETECWLIPETLTPNVKLTIIVSFVKRLILHHVLGSSRGVIAANCGASQGPV